MSWIFGYYSKQERELEYLSQFHPPASRIVKSSRFYIAAGGNKKTLQYYRGKVCSETLICGLPISEDFSGIIVAGDFDRMVHALPEKLNDLNGHFCSISIQDREVSFHTDILGLREFHIHENAEGWYFSTRLDMLLKTAHFDIDFEEFGSKWNLINQLSGRSIIKDIFRLNCGARAIIKQNKIHISEYEWTPGRSMEANLDDFRENLRRVVLLGNKVNSKISLSLSGGLDSRLILSYLLNDKHENWDCHTFVTDSRADLAIAERIADNHNIEFSKIEDDDPSPDEIINDLFEYMGSSYLTQSGFLSRNLGHYKKLPPDKLVIDGGFGEIWRREFLSRLYYLGKNDLNNNNFEGIAEYLAHPRADIFSRDCVDLMKKGIINQIVELVEILPSYRDIGLGNWLDLFSAKTRLVNYYAPEQARIDAYVMSYMPFAQRLLLDQLLNIDEDARRNNRLFRQIIRRNFPKLTKYPLATGNMTYPYWFNKIMKAGYSKVRRKLIKKVDSRGMDSYLDKLREFALDSLSSKSAKEYSPYRYTNIVKRVNAYYNGEKNERTFVDWFISFEVFRQILETQQ